MTENKKKPDPNDPDYFLKIEELVREQDAKQVIRQHKELILANQLAEPLDQETIDRVTIEAKDIFYNAGRPADPQLLQSEIELRLTPYRQQKVDEALRKIRSGRLGTKQNIAEEINNRARTRYQAKYGIQLLNEMTPLAVELRTANSFFTIPLNPQMNRMASKINSFNKVAETISLFGHKINTIPPLDLSHPQKRHSWLVKLQNGEILSDEWLQQTQVMLSRLAS